MKRPLAVAGFATLLGMLAVVQLSPAKLVVVGCLLIVAQVVVLAVLGYRQGYLGLVILFLIVACLLRLGYDYFRLRPLEPLMGSRQQCVARVMDVRPGYGGDTVHAVLEVQRLEQYSGPLPFLVHIKGLPEVEIGDVLALELRFYRFTSPSAEASQLAKGFPIGASAGPQVEVVGVSHNFMTLIRRFQYAVGDNIRSRLPLRLGSVAAAISVGDTRTISSEISGQFRMAGLSHILVVSGLHLSILCAFLRRLVRRFTSNKRLGAGLCFAFVGVFMGFAGFTPSIVRSGIIWLVVSLGDMLERRADTYTSMGLAAFILLFNNPYAAADVGLLLSFAAALGALASAEMIHQCAATRAAKRKKLTASLRLMGENASVSLAVTLATMPVLFLFRMGVSIVSLPANILAVPFVPLLVLGGFIMAIPPAVPVLGWLGDTVALVNGSLLVLLEKLGRFCAGLSSLWIPVGGVFGLVVVLLVYCIAYAGWKTKRLKACTLLVTVALVLSSLLHLSLSAGTVRAVLAGSSNPSLVLIQNRQAVILYRGRLTAGAVANVLKQYRVESCVLLVDMRKTANSTEYEELFMPRQVLTATEDVVSAQLAHPLPDVELTVLRQANGIVACANVAGYKIGLYSGRAAFGSYGPLDMLVAGAGRAEGQFSQVIAGGSRPEWLDNKIRLWQGESGTMMWFRPGKSMVMKEATDGE